MAKTKTKFADCGNIVSLSQTVWPNVNMLDSASDVLDLTNAAFVQHKLKLLSNTLLLTDQVETNTIFNLEASTNINLSQVIVRGGTLNTVVSTSLNLTHSARSALAAGIASSSLNLQHSLGVTRPIAIEVTNSLFAQWEDLDAEDLLAIDPTDTSAVAALFDDIGLRQSVSINGSVYNIEAINYLSLSHQGAKSLIETASNHIHLSHTTRTIEYKQLENILRLQQLAVGHNVQGIEQALSLSHAIVVDGVFPISVTSFLILRSIVSYFIVNFCEYAPGIGTGTFDYTAPSVIVPTLVKRATTVLTWPYASPVLTLALRNPTFDNVEQFEFRRLNRRTRGGTLDLYRDENWPKVRRLIYSFTALSEIQRVKLFEFLGKSIGQEIGLLDFESRQWRGLILTPSSDIKETSRGGCGHKTTLEFEGDLVP